MLHTTPLSLLMSYDAPFSLLTGGYNHCDATWSRVSDGTDHCYKLYVPMRGEGQVTLGNRKTRLRANQAYLIPGYCLSRHDCERSMDVYWLHFTPQSLHLTCLLSRVTKVHAWQRASLAYWATTYRAIPKLFETEEERFARPSSVQYRLQAMLLYLVADVLEREGLSSCMAIDPAVEQLRPAIEFMDQRFLENPSLAEIAKAAHLSPNYFHRKFTAAFHITPFCHMLQRRLNLGRQLLLSTDWRLARIAAYTGFGSEFHFSKAFKKHYRLSPKQFRHSAMP